MLVITLYLQVYTSLIFVLISFTASREQIVAEYATENTDFNNIFNYDKNISC